MASVQPVPRGSCGPTSLKGASPETLTSPLPGVQRSVQVTSDGYMPCVTMMFLHTGAAGGNGGDGDWGGAAGGCGGVGAGGGGGEGDGGGGGGGEGKGATEEVALPLYPVASARSWP